MTIKTCKSLYFESSPSLFIQREIYRACKLLLWYLSPSFNYCHDLHPNHETQQKWIANRFGDSAFTVFAFFFISYTRSVLMNLIPNLLRALATQEMMALSNGQRRPLIEIHHLIRLAGLGFAYRESEMRWRLLADGKDRNGHRMKTAMTACLLACEGLTWVSVFDDLRRAARVSKTKMSQCEYLYFR